MKLTRCESGLYDIFRDIDLFKMIVYRKGNSMEILDKKIEYWKHQLLDLGKRNRMINYRETKRTTIKLMRRFAQSD